MIVKTTKNYYDKPSTSTHFSGKISTELAICSFAIGTLLFLLHQLLPDHDGIVILGISFLLFAILFNGLMLLNLVYHFSILPNQREYIAIKILILLSNIPIALAYFNIAKNTF